MNGRVVITLVLIEVKEKRAGRRGDSRWGAFEGMEIREETEGQSERMKGKEKMIDGRKKE